MRHANLPPIDDWVDGPWATLPREAATFRKVTADRWQDMFERARDEQPGNTQSLIASSEPLPYHPTFMAIEELQQRGYGVGLARFVDPPQGRRRVPKEGLMTYINPTYTAVRPHLKLDFKDPTRLPYETTLGCIHRSRISIDAFRAGSRPFLRSRKTYASLGDSAELAIQRGFMTTVLAEDYKANLGKTSPEGIGGDLLTQRARGLFGILHAEGVRPYNYAELGAMALCAIDLDGLNSLGLQPPIDRAELAAGLLG